MASTERNCGYYNPELEVLPINRRREYQLDLLRRQAVMACRESAATRKQFESAGLDPERVVRLEDISSLPLIRKRDFAAIQRTDPPFGGFNTVSVPNLGHIFVSPGPIYDPEGKEEDFWNLRQAFYAGGFRTGDLVQNTFAYHLTPAGHMCDQALRDLGCVVVPTGVGNTEIQARTMKDLMVTAYIGTPSYLMTILNKSMEMGYDPVRDFSLEMAYVAAEILPPSLRAVLSDRFHLHVRQGYITADLGAIGYECSEANGFHVPENVLVEVLDPQTGSALPPGQVGEVVATTLKKSYPLFRFATGDLSLIEEGRCLCGRTSPRLKGVLGRADEATKVRGLFIHPAMIQEILDRSATGLAGQAIISRRNYQDELVIKVFSGECVEPFDCLSKKIITAAKDILKLRVDVESISEQELRLNNKKIVDNRTWE